jgi:hypothetical protein
VVGLFRKIASISTVGMTDFRSDEERLARKPRVREPRRGVPRRRRCRRVYSGAKPVPTAKSAGVVAEPSACCLAVVAVSADTISRG